MVQHLFTRLPQFVDDTRVLPNMKVSFTMRDSMYLCVKKIKFQFLTENENEQHGEYS